MSAITISRQYGSGGNVIAVRVSEILGYRILDRRLIMQAAAEAGLPEQGFVDISEQEFKVKGFRDRLVELIFGPVLSHKSAPPKLSWGGLEAQMDADWFVELVNATVLSAYQQGGVIIIGRGGQVILRDKPGVLHTRIEAPIETRIQRVQQAEGVNEITARQRIDEHDQASARYLRQNFKVQWDDPLLYHLVINTGKWNMESAAHIIVEAAKITQAVPTA
ncbi:MAG: cytidylate kinase-like family protein [Chloroflexi bacterium]|nr:cytidylate kinase-like family protein [Chloroflexota bacterium]